MSLPELSQLGKTSAYPEHYDAGLLFPLPRLPKRQEIDLPATLPFIGADLWTAYELSWLNPKGKPQVAMASISVPAQSSHIIESKSLKLYLASLNQHRLADAEALKAVLERDLSAAIWHGGVMQERVGIQLILPEQFDSQPIHELDGLLLDRLDITCDSYQPDASLLRAKTSEPAVTETLTSHLLKSNCLVTGQPDWGGVQIRYHGPAIDQERLLQYLVGFRQHNEFHEQCVERIYWDIWRHCQPTQLFVYARYTRRGGLDINPWRSSAPMRGPLNIRTARQ